MATPVNNGSGLQSSPWWQPEVSAAAAQVLQRPSGHFVSQHSGRRHQDTGQEVEETNPAASRAGGALPRFSEMSWENLGPSAGSCVGAVGPGLLLQDMDGGCQHMLDDRPC